MQRPIQWLQNLTLSSVFAAACFPAPHSGSVLMDKNHKNVLGQPLVSCGKDPLTGYYRDGFCATGPEDTGVHVVCAQMTLEFLEFSKSRGNDLMTSQPASGFKGLKAGDRWCLCASRWKEAFDKNLAPPVILESTHENALRIVTLENLKNTCLK